MERLTRRTFTTSIATACLCGGSGCIGGSEETTDGVDAMAIGETTETRPISYGVYYDQYAEEWGVGYDNNGISGRVNVVLFECEEGRFTSATVLSPAEFCTEVHRETQHADEDESVHFRKEYSVERQDGKDNITAIATGTIVRQFRCAQQGGTVIAQLHESPSPSSMDVVRVVDEAEYEVTEGERFTVTFSSAQYPAIAPHDFEIRIVSEDGRVLAK